MYLWYLSFLSISFTLLISSSFVTLNCVRVDTSNNSMVKCVRINKVKLSATIRVNLDELRIITDSVDYMADKHKANLLNLSPDKEETKKLADYNAIKENLLGILNSLEQK
jgi:hypothetical protein